MTEHEELAQLVDQGTQQGPKNYAQQVPQPAIGPPSPIDGGDFCQYSVLPNGRFSPSWPTCPRLSAGAYVIREVQTPVGFVFERTPERCDDLVDMEDAGMRRVLRSIRQFWTMRERYEQHGLLYKRAALLWGPPGSGKTSLIRLLSAEIKAAHDGVVFFHDADPSLVAVALKAFRQVEPDRLCLLVMEDIDEILERNSEHRVLALLDGEHQIDNVCVIATTNYPDRLGARIVNRPSRFDEVVKIGYPSLALRTRYLRKLWPTGDDATISAWVDATDGMTLAHLKEVYVAVHILGHDYTEVMERLTAMGKRLPEDDGFKRGGIGLR